MNGEPSGSNDESSGPCKLPLQYLKDITDNFSEERLLGEGGFGKVYRGMFKDETTIAVKRLESSSMLQVQEKQFLNEVQLLMKLNHPNVVRLLGYCFETNNDLLEYNGKSFFAENQQRLLCLEYLPNSLHTQISDESSGLDWRQRYKIIKGICFGLHYLHEECLTQFNASIIHMDLKPENILLDYKMVPKIADFGLSRLFDDGKTHALATSVVGSRGYMAPEYLYNGVITTKTDIYSLGVIIFKVISGRMFVPYEQSYENFTEKVLIAWRDRLAKAHCTSLETDCNQIKICLDIGKSCTESNPNDRPATTKITEKITKWESRNFYVSDEEKQHADKDYVGILITYIYRDLGFSDGCPIGAIVIYMCLLEWKSFQAETTDIFNRIMHSVGRATEAQGTNIKLIAYWLSNIATLTVLLQRNLKKARYTSNVKMKRAIVSSEKSNQRAIRPLIETKYPAVLFKKQVVEFLEKFYGVIRDNLRKDISPLLGLIMQASITSNASTRSESARNDPQTLTGHWQGIAEILTNYLNALKTNHVQLLLINKIFEQVFSFIDVRLFNNLLLQRESCSYKYGLYLKAGLAELEQWCITVTKEYAGSSWDELKHVWQAAEFFVTCNMPKKTLQEITEVLCPMLNKQQLCQISSRHKANERDTNIRGVSESVLVSLRAMTLKETNIDFLLNEDSSIPFSVDDITNSATKFEATDVDIPPSILEKCGLPTRNKSKD